MGDATGPNPADRGKAGWKHHLLVDGGGIPLNSCVSGADAPGVTRLGLLVATTKSVVLARNGQQKAPQRLLGDRAYDTEGHRQLPRWLGIEPVLAERGTDHGSDLGAERYVVEQTFAAIHQNRRLKVRYEKRADIHEAFLTLDHTGQVPHSLIRPLQGAWHVLLPPVPRHAVPG